MYLFTKILINVVPRAQCILIWLDPAFLATSLIYEIKASNLDARIFIPSYMAYSFESCL